MEGKGLYKKGLVSHIYNNKADENIIILQLLKYSNILLFYGVCIIIIIKKY